MAKFFKRFVRQVKKYYSTSEIIIFFVVLAVAIFFIVSLIINLKARNERNAEPTLPNGETVYFSYNANSIAAFPNIAVNPRSKEAFTFEEGILKYSGEEKTRFGIDISEHQNTIDWSAVKAAGVDFAFIRVGRRGATKGLLFEDSNYKTNIEGALAAGIDVGVYFYSQAITEAEAKEEAEMVLRLIEPYKKGISYPVVFDWEHYTQCDEPYRTLGTPKETLTDACIAFCETIKKAGYTPMVYFNLELAYMEYDLGRLADYDFWIAEFDAVPSFYYNYAIAQYTEKGKIDGIEGNVDLNIGFIDYSKR
jgi:GH25 family lysozyme M1 (1,4-beta-N-acetylmuramidase)